MSKTLGENAALAIANVSAVAGLAAGVAGENVEIAVTAGVAAMFSGMQAVRNGIANGDVAPAVGAISNGVAAVLIAAAECTQGPVREHLKNAGIGLAAVGTLVTAYDLGAKEGLEVASVRQDREQGRGVRNSSSPLQVGSFAALHPAAERDTQRQERGASHTSLPAAVALRPINAGARATR
ncbi:hypothetical protein [Streptomyces cyaneofuscatus]|uniref:hypothetical protein n=1 Tax=Streptomyces cyaneofuscatus TaxID=66883 RepID=UPI0033AB2117